MRGLRALLVAGFGLVILGGGINPASGQSGVIQRVDVQGTQRIEPETIKSYMLVRPGDRFDQQRISDSLKQLYSTGLFSDVEAGRKGGVLIVRVIENPIINQVAFEGNDIIEDDALNAEVSSRPRDIYSRAKVQADLERMTTLYRRSGRFAVTIDPKIIKLDQNRVNLVYEINEGPVTEVRAIKFIGNEAFSDSRLRSEISTTESAWYRFFSSTDNYDPDRLAYDGEKLKQFYLRKGYADFSLVSSVAELAPDEQGFYITFTVDEGERYRIRSVNTEILVRDLTQEQIAGEVGVSAGDWYNARDVAETVDDLTTYIAEMGFSFVKVDPQLIKDRETQTIDLTFVVGNGPRQFVERINIRGNTRTMDEVIRREFRLVEGDPFNVARFRHSKRRIENLDYFGKVEMRVAPGSAPDKAAIDVEVEEKSTGSLSLGFGYSSVDGPLADVSLRERNLMGRGQDLSVSVSLSGKKTQASLSFTEPYFLGRDVAAGFDVFHTTRDNQDESSYDITTTGGKLRVSYPITEYLRQGFAYTYRNMEITDVPDTASVFIKNQMGTYTLSELSHSLTYDKRDSIIFPSEGYVLSMTNSVAGLGGDAQYFKNEVSGKLFVPVADQWTLMFSGSAGHMANFGDDILISDRFFLGGNQVRGFRSAGVGPRDLTTDDALGGQFFYAGTVQLSFPLGLPKEYNVTGRVFTDVGSLWDPLESSPIVTNSGSVRASAGVGFTWVSPMGPIGIDYAIPYASEDYDKIENLKISFGTTF